MSSRRVRTGAAALLAGVLAVSVIAVFHRASGHDPARHRAAFAAHIADTLAPAGKAELPGVAAAPVAIIIAAGAPSLVGTADTSSIPASRTALSGTVRGPPGQAAA